MVMGVPDMSSIMILDRPMYSITEAARLLELQARTLRRWLEGFTYRGRTYEPVIRVAPTGSPEVTWAEFVEAGFLRGYRHKGLRLQNIRPFIDKMREELGVPYPLAHYRPFIDPAGGGLLVQLKRIEDEVDLADDLSLVLVNPVSGQLVMAPALREFLERVRFDAQGVAQSLSPLGMSNPISIDPNLAFGVPQISGIRTELIADEVAAGESRERVAADYALTLDEVDAAVAWELRVRSTRRVA